MFPDFSPDLKCTVCGASPALSKPPDDSTRVNEVRGGGTNRPSRSGKRNQDSLPPKPEPDSMTAFRTAKILGRTTDGLYIREGHGGYFGWTTLSVEQQEQARAMGIAPEDEK